MRIRHLVATACLLAVACGPAFAQGRPSGPSKIGGKSVEQWIKEIKSADPGVRETAIKAVPYFREQARDAVPLFIADLRNDTDAACRVHAALGLSLLADHVTPERANEVVRVLADKADSDGQAIVRFYAAYALASYGQRGAPAIAALINHIHDPVSWELRQAVVYSLASVASDKNFGPDPRAVVAVSRLLAQGQESSSRVRLAAVTALRVFGNRTGEKELNASKDALIRALRDPDRSVAIWALVGLMVVDQPTDQRLSDLCQHLKSSDVMARTAAASALGVLDKKLLEPRIPDLIQLLNDEDPLVLATAIDVLTGLGREASGAVPDLQRIMMKQGQTKFFIDLSADALKKITGKDVKKPEPSAGPARGGSQKPPEPKEIGGKTLDQWIKEIKSPDPSNRELAMRAVPYFGSKAKAAAPALASRLGRPWDPDAACRVHAALALSAIAEHLTAADAAESIKVLSDRAYGDHESIVRYNACQALGSFGSQASSAIPRLLNGIHDIGSWEVRQAAVTSLANIAAGDSKAPADGHVVGAIANRLLNDEERSAEVRQSSVMALGMMGRPVGDREFKLAVQALQKAVNDRDKAVSIWAVVALMAVDKVTPQGLDKLAEHMKKGDSNAKNNAARALGAMGKEAKPKIPDIIRLLKDEDPAVVSTAIEVLGGLGSLARDAAPELQRIMDKKDQTEYFKELARWAIDQVEGKPKK
jgi:HEAT repeat protein